MNYGPVVSYSVQMPPVAPGQKPTLIAAKGIVVKLGAEDEASVCFDTDTLRMAASWTRGFLDLRRTTLGTYKGEGTGAAEMAGTLSFRSIDGPGWSLDAEFADPRARRAGPLPKEHGRFKGVYLHGERAIFSYLAAGCEVWESPELRWVGGERMFVRRVTLGPSEKTLYMQLASFDQMTEARGTIAFAPGTLTDEEIAVSHEEQMTLVRTYGVPAGTRFVWSSTTPRILPLAVPARAEQVTFEVAIWNGAAVDRPPLSGSAELLPLPDLCRGGPARWPQQIEVQGTRAADTAAYVVDTIPVPEENPWKSWMRTSALDFFADGRAAVATLGGDVWIVSGLDEKLARVTWKRFAVGLYEPLGLKIVDDKIYVQGRDQITRLHDLNGDDEADFYECFNSDREILVSYHGFTFDLQTDRAGDFYYVVGGNWLGAERPWHACLVKVSRDGASSEILASGFRAPNGMGIGPNDEIVVSDNQGQWIPANKISRVQRGGFYGHVADPRVDAKAVAPASFEPPLCYLPQALDNSSGGQLWVSGGKWGPLEGRMLHTSYGASALFTVLEDEVDGVAQGAVVKFPLKFASGIMRGRFHPRDGQLYVVGLKGWQTNGAKDGCLQRVRFTGQPHYLPVSWRIGQDSISLSFDVPLDPASASEAQNFAVQQWNYQWWSTYGSPDLSVVDPGKKSRDQLEVASATLSPDARTVTLRILDLKPAMQVAIKLNLQAADGADIATEVTGTINRVPLR